MTSRWNFPPPRSPRPSARAAVGPQGRTDLRDLPLVTIDGEDARDFDDAVFAEPRREGFRLVVAIADVAHYVRPDSALDRVGAHPRQFLLLPRPRRADAAGGAVERLVQPAPRRGSRLPVRRNARRCRRAQNRPSLRPRPDAQRRPPHLRAGAGGARRRRRSRPAAAAPSMPPSAPCWPPATPAARSTSTCPSARSCWTTPGGSPSVRPSPATRQPPADRGVHGAGQCVRRRGTGTAAPALRLPRACPALGGETGDAARLPAQLRHHPAAGQPDRTRATSTGC